MNQPVTAYTLPNCVQCTMTKQALDNAGIAYVIIDLASNEQTLNVVKQLGLTAAPVVVVGDAAWSGFRPDKIRTISAARPEKGTS